MSTMSEAVSLIRVHKLGCADVDFTNLHRITRFLCIVHCHCICFDVVARVHTNIYFLSLYCGATYYKDVTFVSATRMQSQLFAKSKVLYCRINLEML